MMSNRAKPEFTERLESFVCSTTEASAAQHKPDRPKRSPLERERVRDGGEISQ